MNAAHHVVNHWPHRNQLFDGIDILVLEAQLANKGQLGVDCLFAQMPKVEIHDWPVRSIDGPALLLFLNECLGESIARPQFHGTQYRFRFGRAEIVVLQIPVAILVQ